MSGKGRSGGGKLIYKAKDPPQGDSGGQTKHDRASGQGAQASRTVTQKDEAAELERIKKEQEAAERQRQEEEQRRLKEEEDRKKREEKERLQREEDERALQEEIKKRQEFLAARAANLRAEQTRPDASHFKQLDSSIKKNSTFIKKIQARISDENREALIKEIRQLNLTRYVSELAAAIAQVPLKAPDMDAVIKVCSMIHQLYADFTPQLIPALSKALTAATQSDKEESVARRRLLLRLLCDLFVVGVYSDESVIMAALKELLTTKEKPSQMLVLVIAFVRSAGVELLGMIPRGQKKPVALTHLVSSSSGAHAGSAEAESVPSQPLSSKQSSETEDELFSSVGSEPVKRPSAKAAAAAGDWESDPMVTEILSAEKRQPFITVIERFYEKMCQFMLKEFSTLRKVEKQNHELLVTKGEVSQTLQEEYEKNRQSFFKLQNNMIQLAELMDRDMPELPEEEKTTRVAASSSDGSAASGASAGSDAGTNESGEDPLWDDEDTRSLYEVLPDLKDMLPAVLLGLNTQAATPTPASTEEASSSTATTAAPAEGSTATAAEEPASATATAPAATVPEATAAANSPAAPITPVEASSGSTTPSAQTPTSSAPSTPSLSQRDTATSDKMTLFLQHLSKCVNRDMIDQAAVDFAYINSRANRARIVKHMFTVPRQRLDVLPYYSRFIAIWFPYAKDMGKELTSKLEEEFKQLYAQKDQINIETKVKNIRFLSELVKFRVCPTNTIFNCLKMCIDDFKYHNVDVACSLIESCGRFLYRQSETRTRMNTLLDIMMQVKSTRNFSPTVELAVENAYYYCKPAERTAIAGKQRSPMHEYIRRLLFSEPAKDNTAQILRQLRRLNWSNPDDYNTIVRCFTKIYHSKWHNIGIVASLAAGLAQFHDEFGVQLVDILLENIRTLLELHDPQHQQRLVMNIKYLGELYNYQLVDHAAIFSILYTLTTFGYHLKGSLAGQVGEEEATSGQAQAADDAAGDSPAAVIPMSEWNPLDMPHESVRARLVCVLLDTCGSYFKRGSTKEKLDRFLIYFQRYLLAKTHLSRDMLFTIDDLFTTLRPRMRRFRTYKEAAGAIGQIEDSQRAKNPDYVPIDILMCPPHKIKRPAANSASGSAGSQSQADNEDEQDKEFSKEFTEAEPIQVILDDEDAMIAAELAAQKESANAESGSVEAPAVDNSTDPEEEAFAKEFELMIAENREARRNDVSLGTRASDNALIATPMSVIKKTLARTAPNPLRASGDAVGSQEEPSSQDETASSEQSQSEQAQVSSSGGMQFKLIMRKGNKPQAVSVEMPVDSDIVQKQMLKRDEERMQKEALKKLTLKLDQMDREEKPAEGAPAPATQTVQLGPKPYLQTQRGRTNPEYQNPQYQNVYTAASAALRGEDVPMFTIAGVQPSANPNRGRGGYRGGPPRKR